MEREDRPRTAMFPRPWRAMSHVLHVLVWIRSTKNKRMTITLSGIIWTAMLTFAKVTNPAHGTLGMTGMPACSGTPSTCTASVTYTPTTDYTGADSFTFRVNQAGQLGVNQWHHSITVSKTAGSVTRLAGTDRFGTSAAIAPRTSAPASPSSTSPTASTSPTPSRVPPWPASRAARSGSSRARASRRLSRPS